MARVNNGILDGFSGTVGTVIGGNWKGIDYMRSKSKKRGSRAVTAKQLVQRIKFAAGIKLQNAMRELFTMSFSGYAKEMTGPNNALSHMLMNAVKEENGVVQVSYPQVLVSRGSYPNVFQATATAEAGAINFTWEDNTGSGSAKDTDKVLLVAFCEELDACIFKLGVAVRSTETAKLNTPRFAGKLVHTWISFTSDNEKKAARSIYTGAVTIL